MSDGIRFVRNPAKWACLVISMILAMLFLWRGPVYATSFTVNSLADTNDGMCDAYNCTLREAINAANWMMGVADTISFSVSGTITLSSALPSLTDPAGVTIDGGNNITLDGGNSVGIGLQSSSSQNNVLRNLTIRNFAEAGIEFVTYTSGTDGGHQVENVTLDNCVIGIRIYNGTGVTVTRSTLINNSEYGVDVEWFSGVPNVAITDNTIGSSGSGNGVGIQVANEGADGVTISGNSITHNLHHGIQILGGADNTSIQSNTIEYNGTDQNDYGIYVTGEGTDDTQITGNTSVGYTQGHGIAIVSGPDHTVIQGNTIHHNGQTLVGVYAGSGILVEGDSTDATLIGGTGAGEGNTVHNNVGNGIVIQGGSSAGPADTNIVGNSIYSNSQADIDGVGILVVGIVEDGSDADSYTVVVQGNTINDNYAQGILIENGGVASPADALIGGTYSSEGNLIYGNGQEGVLIRDGGTNDHLVKGNTIGINAVGGTSANASPNGNSGVAVTNGAQNNIIEDNDIAYNTYQDVLLSGSGTSGNIVRNNTIDSDSTETPHNYDNTGVMITDHASSNTIGPCNSITDHVYEGVLIMGDNADSNQIINNDTTCASTPGDTAGIYRSGRGISVINHSVSGEAFGRTDSDGHTIPGPDSTLIQSNTIASNESDGVYIKLTSNTSISSNTIISNSENGILWVGSVTGTIQANTVATNTLHGLRVEPHYGSNTSPDTAGDDHVNGDLLIGTSTANTFNNNGQSGVYIIDDDIGYTASQIATNNNFSGNGDNQVQQDWLGVVEILQGSGSSWTTVTSGQTVQITSANSGPTWSGSTYDSTDSDSNRGVWGPSGLDYDDVDTWFHVTEEVVDNSGTLHTYTAHTVSTSGALNHPGASFSYDGDSTSDPVSPDYGLAFSDDTSSNRIGRYQIAQLLFNPTAVTLASLSGHSSSQPILQFLLTLTVGLLGVSTIGVLIGRGALGRWPFTRDPARRSDSDCKR